MTRKLVGVPRKDLRQSRAGRSRWFCSFSHLNPAIASGVGGGRGQSKLISFVNVGTGIMICMFQMRQAEMTAVIAMEVLRVTMSWTTMCSGSMLMTLGNGRALSMPIYYVNGIVMDFLIRKHCLSLLHQKTSMIVFFVMRTWITSTIHEKPFWPRSTSGSLERKRCVCGSTKGMEASVCMDIAI